MLPPDLLDDVAQDGGLRRAVGDELTAGFKLSGFQKRATQQILDDVKATKSRGVIVGAGTGAGKTLAFYLPAYMAVSDLLDGQSWTKVVALYPRNELLKDQLQTAVENAQKVRGTLVSAKGRPMRIGVLFGDVPHGVSHLKGKYGRWPKRGKGSFVCPYLRCPGPASTGTGRCHGDLVLDTSSSGWDPSELCCADCGFVLSSDDFAITRDQMRRRPPDLLFSSTEMLNRGLLDPSSAHVYGIDAHRGPALVLLDEVHTYGGTTGAMTALLLRRWRRRLRTEPAFVGLSATLTDAGPFFADLIGLDEDRVTPVEPYDDELVPEGAEYLLAVRSDPVSGAGVLSTTIQTAMLLGRVLDPIGQPVSGGLYGSKVFCFTDDLDVTNRLYFDLLDAEGMRAQPWAATDKPYRASLAHLRHPTHGDVTERRAAGQLWDLPISLGHGLSESDRLEVQRVSSQDAGVDSRKPLVVATASLEVGFDDPDVGAVIQHKAPRDVASFLQRKGRAGRPRGMRPITAVVLSDYGRDRQAFESWDRLFDPVLPARRLPVANIHVLRMQATGSLLEWVARELKADDGNLWQDLQGPNNKGDKWGDEARQRQQDAAGLLRGLLSSKDLQRALRSHLQESLGIEPQVADELLWHPPRAILLGAVPALLRRLETGWRAVTVDGAGPPLDRGAKQPLPEFMPENLFSELALPEMVLHLPVGPPDRGYDDDVQPMGLVQGLREFAPGRVSRRFAIKSGLDLHWIAPPSNPRGSLEIGTFVDAWRREGSITIDGPDGPAQLPLLRPTGVQAARPPDDIKPSSNARPIWRSQLLPSGTGSDLPVVTADPVGSVLNGLTAFLHRDHAEVEARRGSIGSHGRLTFKGGGDLGIDVRFENDGGPAALGGAFDVDAIRGTVTIGTDDVRWDGAHGRGLRSAWFHHRVTTDEALSEQANPFLLGWLHDVVLTSILGVATSQNLGLPEAWETVRADLKNRLEESMSILFSSPGLKIDEVDVDSGPARLVGELEDLLDRDEVASGIARIVPVLWSDPDEEANRWVATRLRRTLGEAMLVAAAQQCPAHDPEGVVVDVEPGFDAEGKPRTGEVWLSETSIGGGGFLEAVAEAIGRDPVRFQRLVRTAMRPGPEQRIGDALERVLAAATSDTSLRSAFAAYRAVQTMESRVAALATVRSAMEEAGVPAVPDTVAAVANRLLRPGSDATIDQQVHDSHTRWKELEERLGIDIEVRTWCFLDSANSGSLDRKLLETLQLVLWPRGWRLQAANLSSWNPFDDAPAPAPALLETLLTGHDPVVVDLTDNGAEVKVADALRSHAAVDVRAAGTERERLASFLASTTVTAVDLDYLQLYPRVAQIREFDGGGLLVRLELPEDA
ncbi:Lhr-like helicase [Euzebya pacifica]|uniref:Lhr-like helicase n=1 Tax=Euzebya pacifica TaxID=1608957 RepID=A0A346XS48_9ACTN|nr:Lhr-like helicase [Euzebya pacifica]